MDNISTINEKRGEEFAHEYMTQLRDRLNACKGEWPRLRKLSGGKFSYSWIVALASGERIKDSHLSMAAELGSYLGIKLQAAECPAFNEFKPQ